VVVNQQEQPQGLVFLHRLLPHLFACTVQVQPKPVDINPLVLKQTLETQQESLVEPVIVLPERLDLSELGYYLQSCQSAQTPNSQVISTIAVVNQSGQFLGLLDTLSCLQMWTQQRPVEVPPRSEPPPPSQGISPFLQHLLEQFPVPLMIQQENGTVILQNWAWQSRLHTGSETVRHTSETVVHFSPNPPPSSDHPLNRLTSDSSLNPLPSWCQLGPQPDTYICVCSTADDQEQVWQFIRQPLQSPWSEVFRDQSPSQPCCWHNPQPVAGGEPQTPQLWLILAQDITEQHRVSQELAAKNADLVHLNRLKDEFLACISHELKSPLTAILGLSKLLNEPLLGSLNERQTHYAQLIYQSGRHLMMVVNDILDLTRIETGQLELSPGLVQIRAVCQQGFAMAVGQQQEPSQSPTYRNLSEALDQRIAEAQQRFTLEIDPGLDGLVADELRLRQMLAHLISNALKFTPQPRKLGLRVSLWDHWIAFTVWDEGIGIPEDKQHLIFQKFQQLQSPLTREYQGTGLGLVLTQRLAHLHGGDVSFMSQAGEGSQFTLLLPPSPPQVNELFSSDLPRTPSCPQSTEPSRLVLIVEAVPSFIHHLSEQLNQIGYQVVIARSGTEALEKARCLQPHVIFLNPLLPLLSGWDVLTLLKTDQKTHQIPVIITATLGDKKRAIQNDSNGFLCLPVQPAELQKTLAIIDQKPLPKITKKLTILWLNPIEEPNKSELQPQDKTETTAQHSSWILHHCSRCRILEADDLIQAELLGRIWQPDVMILQSLSGVQSPSSFLKQLTQHEGLANLPLITLDSWTTELANQVDQLSVFPCLINSLDYELDSIVESALLQVIQIATGENRNRKGSILVVDLLTLSQSLEPDVSTGLALQTKIDHALIHYLETAGFRSFMGHSWPEAIQSIKSKTVDLLLISARDCPTTALIQGLNWIKNLEVSIPILIWERAENQQCFNQTVTADQSLSNNHSNSIQVSAIPVAEIQQLINELGIQVLPPETSIVELLKTIRQCFQMHH
jgi:signal transduction histidine kinase/ActR/RegA family two-component response regulator